MKSTQKTLFQEAIDTAFDMLQHAQVGLSGHRVGAAVIASSHKKEPTHKVFGGCNIEFSAGAYNIHAERLALVKAISEGYTEISYCFVTSSNFEQRAAMCGYCMQDFMYVNPNCIIIVLNPDKSEKIRISVLKRNGEYAYLGKGRINHDG